MLSGVPQITYPPPKAIVNSDYPDGVVPKEKWQEALHVNTLSTSTVGDVMLSATASSALSISNTPAPTPTAEAAGAVGVTEGEGASAVASVVN